MPPAEAAVLHAQLAAKGTPARAAGAKAYMRSDLEFLGVTVPDIRRIAAAWLNAKSDLDRPTLRSVVDDLWRPAIFESRMLATVLLQRRSALIGPRDLPWLERLVRACRGWALMDNLAPYAVADVLGRDPGLRARTLARWASDPDFWVRRAALLTMHRDLARGAGDWLLWVRLAEAQLEDQPRWAKGEPSPDERFFIRKALGWVLRDRSRSRPGDTVAFVRTHRGRMAGLTLREATRHLPANLQAKAMAG